MITSEKHCLLAISPSRPLTYSLIKFIHRHNINSPQTVNIGVNTTTPTTLVPATRSISMVVPYTRGLYTKGARRPAIV